MRKIILLFLLFYILFYITNAIFFESFSDCKTGFLRVFDNTTHLPISDVNVLLTNKTIGINISAKTDFDGNIEFNVPLNVTYNLTINNSSYIVLFKCEKIYSLSAPLQVCKGEEYNISSNFSGNIIAFFYSNKTGLVKFESNGTFMFSEEGAVTYKPIKGIFKPNLITLIRDCYKNKLISIKAKKIAYVGDTVWVKAIDVSTGLSLNNIEINVTNGKDRFSIITKEGVAYYNPDKEGVYIYSTSYPENEIICTVVFSNENNTKKGFVRFDLRECFFNTCLIVKGISLIDLNSFELDIEGLNTRIESSEFNINQSYLFLPFVMPLILLFSILFEEKNVKIRIMGNLKENAIIGIKIIKNGKPWNGRISIIRNNVWFYTLNVIKGKVTVKLGERGIYKIIIGSSIKYKFKVR